MLKPSLCLLRQIFTYVEGLVVDVTALKDCYICYELPVNACATCAHFDSVRGHWLAGRLLAMT